MVKCKTCGKEMFETRTNENLFVYECCGNMLISSYELNEEEISG